MKKILFLLVAAICTFAACDPVHEDVSNAGHITLDELIAKTTVSVDKAENGNNGNVVTCKTSAPVNAKWSIDGKEFVGNYAWKKMKVKWDDNGDYVKTPYTVVLTALCPDGTQLKAEFPIECDEITNPGAWDAAAMRFSSSEGAHLPTISDDVYFGLKTLILDISDAENCDLKVMNGWWSNTYYDHVKLVSGLNEIQITETMAKECAKGNGGEGRDLDLMLYSGTMTLNAVYYEE